MSLPITSQPAAGRSRCDGVDPGVDREWLPVHPTVPFESASGNDWKEAGRAVPADKAECRLWVQKGDARRNAPQRARCAVSGHTTTAAGAAQFDTSRSESAHRKVPIADA